MDVRIQIKLVKYTMNDVGYCQKIFIEFEQPIGVKPNKIRNALRIDWQFNKVYLNRWQQTRTCTLFVMDKMRSALCIFAICITVMLMGRKIYMICEKNT